MNQSQRQLSEFQETIKELQKHGSFTDEELQYLRDMDKSIEELNQELQPKVVIQFSNGSSNPDPILEGSKISFRASLPSEVYFIENRVVHIPTGIELTFPSYLLPVTKTNCVNPAFAVLDYYTVKNKIIFRVLNTSEQQEVLHPGDVIADIFFTYGIDADSVVLKRIES
jgi:hypothetical protein